VPTCTWHVPTAFPSPLGRAGGRAHLLDLPDAHDQRKRRAAGALPPNGDHIRVGAGYNFSDFSDDLTDLSYKHQGVFVNIVGTI